MSISKIHVKSAVVRHNHDSATSTTFPPKPIEATKSFKKNSPKNLQKQKSQIFSLSTANASEGEAALTKASYEAAIVAGTMKTTAATTLTTTTTTTLTLTSTPTPTPPTTGSACSTGILSSTATPTITTITTTNILPQSLLKIEPFVPSLPSRIQKPIIRRSYSTLSTTTLKKRLHNVNSTKLAVNLEIANANSKKTTAVAHETNVDVVPLGMGSITNKNTCYTNSTSSVSSLSLAQVAKPPHSVRRRQPLRGTVNRQRSKSTSSSNSAATNRPATSLATVANASNTPNLVATPCSSPHNAVVIPQPNGICRIQRNIKEQEKMPDRINYDKRGLTAIPIFEQENNLRLLSLQHNLINTFHIPKEVKVEVRQEVKAEDNSPSVAAATRTADLQITNSINTQNSPGITTAYPRTRFPNSDLANSQLALQNILPNPPNDFAAYMLQRNKLLHRSINLNNVALQQNALQPSGAPRFAMRKSKSFVNNFNLQYQISKRQLQNPRANLLRRAEALGHLISFDSSASNLTTTDSSSTSSPMPDIDENPDEVKLTELEIKNRQLLANYGTIFQNLVFLDLYDNQIERISNLDGLTALSVLLLGKNRIMDISGLASLKATLRVLDLHGNKLCSIANKINCLKELKSLNLAGNQLRQINNMDFLGLCNLKELNLKRNKLKRVNGFQHLVALERLWLCHNDLHKVDDMSTIAKASNLIEVTMENNPISLAGDCVSFLVSYLPKLQTLSQMPITEQVRKAAMTWRTNKELSEQSSQQGNKEQFNLIRREEIISNARTNWELLRSQQTLQQNNGSIGNNDSGNSGSSGNGGKKLSKASKINGELEKITETNEQSYEEFIKLPPIETKQTQQNQETEERSSSASSLGPNVNSSSSCYSSGDDDETDKKLKDNKKKSVNSNFPPTSNGSILPSKTNQNELPLSKENVAATKNEQNIAVSTTLPICPTTLMIQFPTDGMNSKLANHSSSQNQTANQTTLINGCTAVASSSMVQTSTTTSSASSTSPLPSPGCSSSATGGVLSKRGTLIRSQTIVGPGGASGYTLRATTTAITTTTATATATTHINSIRYNGTKQPSSTYSTTHPTTAPMVAAHLQQTATTTTTTSPNHTTTLATVNANGQGVCLTSSNTNKMSSNNNNNIAVPTGASATKLSAIEREREQGGDYLIEICGRYLNIYGQGALRFIDKQWNPSKANDVHTLNFSYINFNSITAILSRIKVRFPHAENFVFRETNINCLGQLNALAELQGITSLFIDPEGNSLTSKDLWRQYAIYRLSHWGLKTLNSLEVTPHEIDKANNIYAGLSELILWSMPDAMLQPLLTRLRLDESCTASKMVPKQWLQKPDNRSLRLVVGKEALQWKKCHQLDAPLHGLPTPQQIRQLQAQFCAGDIGADVNSMVSTSTSSSSSMPLSTCAGISSLSAAPASANASAVASLTQRERGKIHFTLMMENTCNAVEKLHKLDQIWGTMLLNIVRNTLLDYTQLDVYIRDLMTEIMK